ncbi:hypothetical protein L218DRAFT_198320 [Marasmius fiardii PR-910]|nr:hypothetical protein L218DRAFT_198320 [Marasmius fiardii PR-910]
MNSENVRETASSLHPSEKPAFSQLIESPFPLRRSPRLSSPRPALFDPILESANISGEDSPSRPETPDNDGLVQDEPSSVLASRIMRAHDNPSPPPQSPENTLLHSQLIHDTSRSPTPDTREDPFAENEPQDSISARLFIKPLLYQNPDKQVDCDTPRQSVLPLPLHMKQQDVRLDAHEPSEQVDIDVQSSSEDGEERSVAESLLVGEPSASDTAEPVTESTEADLTQPEEPKTPPLRRSSRPRRSIYIPSPSPLREVAGVTPKFRPTEPLDFSAPELEFATEPPSPTRQNPRKSGHQKLASLSPHSLRLLGEISGETLEDSGVEAKNVISAVAQNDPTAEPVSDFQWPEVTPNTPSRPPVPIRFPSPKRTTRPPSPNKYQLNIPTAGPSTPARRIPIPDAVAQGQLSPQRAAQLSANRGSGTSRMPFLKIPPNDTPARRVPIIHPHSNSPLKLPPDHSLGKRIPLHERSKSVEPEPSVPVRPKPRSESVEPTPINSNGPQRLWGSRSVQRLPFPIIHEDVAEHREAQEPTTSPSKAPSVQRPSLKQATSKIPRRTIKPYSRPTVSTAAKEADNRVRYESPVKMVEPPKATLKKQTQVQTNPSQTTTSSSNPSLKRKRATFDRPSSSKPVVVITPLRQVLSPSKPSTSSRPQISPKKNQSLLNLRLVKVEKPPQPPPVQSSDTPSDSVSSAMEVVTPPTTSSHTPAPLTSDSTQLSLTENVSEPTMGAPVLVQHDAVSDPPPSIAEGLPEPSVLTEEPPEPSVYGLRRTTRVRKPVMGINPPLPSNRRGDGTSQPRRRKPPVFQGTGPFSNMTAGDLRQLTSSNTTRNQQYLTALLETEIVRREGPRPESPGIRAKTVSEKEQEEKEREKNARAERRANRSKRRSGEDDEEGSEKVGLQESDDDDEGDNEAWEHLNSSPSVRRHRRGAGEDEDYETPKQPKRSKSDENVDVDEGSEEGGDKKRVKWDQGLFTEVFLDEVQPRPRNGIVAAGKGCLAPTAKALKLDDLGNLKSIESPLKDLVQENVVVKKFVYDTDLPEPPPPPVVVKNTRSKRKSS